MHLVNGVLGMLLLAFVARPPHVQLLTHSPCGGIFYTRLGWMQLGMQTLGEPLLPQCGLFVVLRCALPDMTASSYMSRWAATG